MRPGESRASSPRDAAEAQIARGLAQTNGGEILRALACNTQEGAMSANSRHYRLKAAESARQSLECKLLADVELFRQAEQSWNTLAENEEWLESNSDKVV